MRSWVIVPILVLVTAVMAGWHGYLIQRLVLDPAPGAGLRVFGIAVVVSLASCIMLQPLAERRLSRRAAAWLAWPASLWMGFSFWLIVSLLVTDLALWLAGGLGWDSEFAGLADPTRVARLRAALCLSLATLASIPALRSGLAPPGLVRVEHRMPRWPKSLAGFRVVQISDIHIGAKLDRRFARHLVDRVNALSPDLIAVTGDLVDGSVSRLADEVGPFADLRARHGVFFVTGNHDHYSDADDWCDHLRGLGMRVLRNERVRIPVAGSTPAESFELAGVDDYRARQIPGQSGSDMSRALDAVPSGHFVLLLAHDPGSFKEAVKRRVDLQLSGHTHGGQIWPFHHFVRIATPFVAGLHRRGHSAIYVSRGTGYWGPPMRLFAPAEITDHVFFPDGPVPTTPRRR